MSHSSVTIIADKKLSAKLKRIVERYPVFEKPTITPFQQLDITEFHWDWVKWYEWENTLPAEVTSLLNAAEALHFSYAILIAGESIDDNPFFDRHCEEDEAGDLIETVYPYTAIDNGDLTYAKEVVPNA